MANDLPCGSLKTTFPKIAVIGEESGEVELDKVNTRPGRTRYLKVQSSWDAN